MIDCVDDSFDDMNDDDFGDSHDDDGDCYIGDRQ